MNSFTASLLIRCIGFFVLLLSLLINDYGSHTVQTYNLPSTN